MTVLEVAVVSGGCAVRVAAVTTMVGSVLTSASGALALAVEVWAGFEAALAFVCAADLAVLAGDAEAAAEEVCAGVVEAGSAWTIPKANGAIKLRVKRA